MSGRRASRSESSPCTAQQHDMKHTSIELNVCACTDRSIAALVDHRLSALPPPLPRSPLQRHAVCVLHFVMHLPPPRPR